MYHKKSRIRRLMPTFIADGIITDIDTLPNFLRLFGYAILLLMFMISMIGINYNHFIVTIIKNLKPQTAFAINYNINNDRVSKTGINEH